MAIVHCRYSHFHEDQPDMPDGYLVACYGAVGLDELAAEDLDWFHNFPPPRPCDCGFVPEGYAPVAREPRGPETF